jgi:hypothetical protein
MADRTCERCGKEFKYPAHLIRHQKRATPCAPILEPDDLPDDVREDPDLDQKKCRFCGRVFSSYDSMRRHVRQYCKIAPTEKNGDAGMEVLYEHTIRRQQAQIEAQQKQIEQLMQLAVRGGAPGDASGSIPAGNTGTQAGEVGFQGDHNEVNNSKNTININVFGKEGLDHITAERVKAILDESISRFPSAPALPAAASAAVLKTAMLAYSDPEHPENLTCYLPNKKTNDALVHGEEGWEVQPTTLVLPPMAQKSVDALFDNQPFEEAETYEGLMLELRDNEERYTAGGELRPILVRNKDLLARALESLPVAGGE